MVSIAPSGSRRYKLMTTINRKIIWNGWLPFKFTLSYLTLVFPVLCLDSADGSKFAYKRQGSRFDTRSTDLLRQALWKGDWLPHSTDTKPPHHLVTCVSCYTVNKLWLVSHCLLRICCSLEIMGSCHGGTTGKLFSLIITVKRIMKYEILQDFRVFCRIHFYHHLTCKVSLH